VGTQESDHLGKPDWRRTVLKQRRATPEDTWAAETAGLRDGLLRWLEQYKITTICGYVPVRGEPGSLELLDDVRATGCRLLLPIVVGPAPLDWAEYTGAATLRPARFGLLEPVGRPLGPGVIAEADAVLVPALAVDRRGVRLGRGGGHYDRSLPLVSGSTELIGVVRDTELVTELPSEDHDARMTGVLTPSRGVVRLPL
jgi:5-formyltetrahydrofolate cyclo-ligase